MSTIGSPTSMAVTVLSRRDRFCSAAGRVDRPGLAPVVEAVVAAGAEVRGVLDAHEGPLQAGQVARRAALWATASGAEQARRDSQRGQEQRRPASARGAASAAPIHEREQQVLRARVGRRDLERGQHLALGLRRGAHGRGSSRRGRSARRPCRPGRPPAPRGTTARPRPARWRRAHGAPAPPTRWRRRDRARRRGPTPAPRAPARATDRRSAASRRAASTLASSRASSRSSASMARARVARLGRQVGDARQRAVVAHQRRQQVRGALPRLVGAPAPRRRPARTSPSRSCRSTLPGYSRRQRLDRLARRPRREAGCLPGRAWPPARRRSAR